MRDQLDYIDMYTPNTEEYECLVDGEAVPNVIRAEVQNKKTREGKVVIIPDLDDKYTRKILRGIVEIRKKT